MYLHVSACARVCVCDSGCIALSKHCRLNDERVTSGHCIKVKLQKVKRLHPVTHSQMCSKDGENSGKLTRKVMVGLVRR